MIEFLEGQLVQKHPTHTVIQTGGVGFRVLTPLSSYDALPPPGKSVKLLTHLAIREDDMTLYGFATDGERDMFLLLIQVSGIGPKLALTILSGMSLREIRVAITQSDVKRLSSISGIGKKTAERMVVDLRDKLGKAEVAALDSLETSPMDTRIRDTLLALVELGFKQQEAKTLLDKVPEREDPNVTADELLIKALSKR